MTDDFNNVQDQNLVDDQMVNQITDSADQAAGGNVGAVVHPDDPAAQDPAVAVPTAQDVLGDKIEDIAANADPNMPPDPVPDPDPAEEPAQTDQPAEEPAVEEPDVEVPEPKIAVPEPKEGPEDQSGRDEEGYIAPPDDEQPVDEPKEDKTPQAEPEKAEDKPSEGPTVGDAKGDDLVAHLGEGTGDDEELMDAKQEALEELSPLVSHLELPPEQKFDTYMEILRASDDKTLIKPALEAAKAIEDDDNRAQALLDVVNEVNYLTQDHKDD